MASSCEAVIFLFGVAALFSYICKAFHNTQLLNNPSNAGASLLVLLSPDCHILIFGNIRNRVRDWRFPTDCSGSSSTLE